MKVLNLQPNTPDWEAARARYLTASEAPAMMGVSPHVTRAQLLHMKATGSEQEFSDFVRERVLERGHEVEAMARPIAEAIIGEDLFPATVTDDEDRLSATLDGMTMAGDVLWECKQTNQDKIARVRSGEVPETDYWQCVQQLVITRAESLLYMVTDGTQEGTHHCWLKLDEQDERRLRGGWEQFERDLAEYKPPEPAEAPLARTPENLPVLVVNVAGSVVESNFDAFRKHAVAVIDGIKTELSTDQDFANAEAAVRWCQGVEDKLKAKKQEALEQTITISELFAAIDEIAETTRSKRLALGKLVKARKDQIRAELISGAGDRFSALVTDLSQKLERVKLPPIDPGYVAAIKGLRSIDSIRDALDQATADASIKAHEEFARLTENLRVIDAHEEYAHLFHDLAALCAKPTEDLREVLQARIDNYEGELARHQKEEEARKAAEADWKATAEQAAAPELPSSAPATEAPRGAHESLPEDPITYPGAEELTQQIARAFAIEYGTAREWLIRAGSELSEERAA